MHRIQEDSGGTLWWTIMTQLSRSAPLGQTFTEHLKWDIYWISHGKKGIKSVTSCSFDKKRYLEESVIKIPHHPPIRPSTFAWLGKLVYLSVVMCVFFYDYCYSWPFAFSRQFKLPQSSSGVFFISAKLINIVLVVVRRIAVRNDLTSLNHVFRPSSAQLRQVITLFLAHIDCAGGNQGPLTANKTWACFKTVGQLLSCWPFRNRLYKNWTLFPLK